MKSHVLGYTIFLVGCGLLAAATRFGAANTVQGAVCVPSTQTCDDGRYSPTGTVGCYGSPQASCTSDFPCTKCRGSLGTAVRFCVVDYINGSSLTCQWNGGTVSC